MKRPHFFTILIPLLCLWHMSAVAISLLPDKPSLTEAKKIINPYVLLTTQWQNWNLFSPEPLNKPTYLSIDALDSSGQWRIAVSRHPADLPFLIKAKEIKALENIYFNNKFLIPQYLLTWCKRAQLQGKNIRMHVWYFIIPPTADIAKMGGWSSWSPVWQDEIVGEPFTCPLPPSHS